MTARDKLIRAQQLLADAAMRLEQKQQILDDAWNTLVIAGYPKGNGLVGRIRDLVAARDRVTTQLRQYTEASQFEVGDEVEIHPGSGGMGGTRTVVGVELCTPRWKYHLEGDHDKRWYEHELLKATKYD